jgi:hypothetical protein
MCISRYEFTHASFPQSFQCVDSISRRLYFADRRQKLANSQEALSSTTTIICECFDTPTTVCFNSPSLTDGRSHVPEADVEPLWTERQTAEYPKLTSVALYRLRMNGKGPAFIVLTGRSKIRYRPSVVMKWLKDRERPSMAAFFAMDKERAANAAKQREALESVRHTRWPRKSEESAA